MLMKPLGRALLAVVCATVLPPAVAQGQAQAPYPNRPVTILLPASPGSNPDTATRLIAKHLTTRLGQPIIVEPKLGAGGSIAMRALAFGMSVAYTARTAKPELPYAFHPTAAALAAQVDFLVVITPGGAGTRKLIDAQVLQALGKGRGEGIVVNVARGSVIDEAALIDALQRGVIAGAGLDVCEDEPRVPRALCDLQHVVLTPHVGSATHGTRQAMADLAFDNLRLRLAGQPVRTPVPECR